MPQVSPAAFSSLCHGFSWPLCPKSAQQPSVPSVMGSPGHCAPSQPSSLQFPLSWVLLATVPQVSPAAFSSLCHGFSWPLCPKLCPRSAQQPSVLCMGSPCCCAPWFVSRLFLVFPFSSSLLGSALFSLVVTCPSGDTSQPYPSSPFQCSLVLEMASGQNTCDILFKYSKGKVKVRSYIARYPVHRTAQSALHFTPWQTCSFQGHLNFFGKYSATLQLLREGYSFIYPSLSVLPGTHLYS